MTISEAQRRQKEDRIRATIDRLLRGHIPPGGRCDIKTSPPKPASPERLSTAPTHT